MTPNKNTPQYWRDALRLLVILAALLVMIHEGGTPEQIVRLLEVCL